MDIEEYDRIPGIVSMKKHKRPLVSGVFLTREERKVMLSKHIKEGNGYAEAKKIVTDCRIKVCKLHKDLKRKEKELIKKNKDFKKEFKKLGKQNGI